MKFKNLFISAVGACVFLGASAASAATAICYENPGNNNGHRFVVHYRTQGYDVILSKIFLENWNGRKYVYGGKTGDLHRRLHWIGGDARSVCKRIYDYNYATQG
jgi:hypothetical protein